MIDQEKLWEMYKAMSIDEIVAALEVPKSEVLQYFKKFKFYQRVKKGIEVKCSRCGSEFTVTSKRITVCQDCLTKAKQERGRKLNERSQKLEQKKDKNTENQIRPYTYTSDLLIQGCIDDGMEIREIARMLDRDADDLAEHIMKMHESKTFERMRTIRNNYQKESRYKSAPIILGKEVPKK